MRNRTVANGASPEEAANSARLADRLEDRYGLRPDGPGVEDGPRRAERPRPRRGSRVVVSAAQHRALQRGETVRKVQLSERFEFRIEGRRLFRRRGDGGESGHDITAVEPSCGNVIVRYADDVPGGRPT